MTKKELWTVEPWTLAPGKHYFAALRLPDTYLLTIIHMHAQGAFYTPKTFSELKEKVAIHPSITVYSQDAEPLKWGPWTASNADGYFTFAPAIIFYKEPISFTEPIKIPALPTTILHDRLIRSSTMPGAKDYMPKDLAEPKKHLLAIQAILKEAKVTNYHPNTKKFYTELEKLTTHFEKQLEALVDYKKPEETPLTEEESDVLI